MLRKLITTIGVLVVLAAVGAGVTLWYVGREGATRIEYIVGIRLQQVANHYLNPTLSFGAIDYQYPRTITITGAQLTTPEGVDVLHVDKVELVLAEVPRTDRPLRIEQVTLVSPLLYFADTLRMDGRIAGWSDLIKPTADQPLPATAELPERRLSDVFQMRMLKIIDGRVKYADLNIDGDQLPPMDLDGIDAELGVEPPAVSGAEPDEQGWYDIETTIAGPAKFKATVKGRADLDHLVLELAELSLRMRLDRETDVALPPTTQQWVRDHNVTGRLHVDMAGRFPLLQLHESEGQADFRVENAQATLEDVMVDIGELSGQMLLRPNKLVLRRLDLTGYDGSAAGRVSLTLDGEPTADVQITGEKLRLERILRSLPGTQSDGKPPLAGRLSFATQLTGPAKKLTTQASGTGWLEVTEGSLAKLPLITRLLQLIGIDGATVNAQGPAGSDTARVEWNYAGDHAQLTRIDALTRWLAVRGSGDLHFDGSLNLILNGGPVERLQHTLGRVGDWLGSVTDRLVAYSVTGKIWNPQVGVRPLRMGSTQDTTAPVATQID